MPNFNLKKGETNTPCYRGTYGMVTLAIIISIALLSIAALANSLLAALFAFVLIILFIQLIRKEKTLQLARFNAAVTRMKYDLQVMILSFKLRTALNNINGYAALLHSGQVGDMTEEQRIHLEYIMIGANAILSEYTEIESASNIEVPIAVQVFKLRTDLNIITGFTNIVYNENLDNNLSIQQKEFLVKIMISSNDIMKLLPTSVIPL